MANDLMRLAGINSGYDTEAMIEKMMSTYQTKIDNQNKKLQKLQWKQEAVRDVTTKLTDFKNKYFDILKRDNYLMSPTSFSKFKSTIVNKTNPDRSSGITVTTSSSSLERDYDITVQQAATATTLKGGTLSTPNFKLDLKDALTFSKSEEVKDADGNPTGEVKYDFSLDVKVGDVSKTIKFGLTLDKTKLFDADGNVSKKARELIESNLDDELEKAFGSTVDDSTGERFLTVQHEGNNTLKFVTGGGAAVAVTENEGYFGMVAPTTKLSIAAQASNTGKNSVVVNVNGIKKKVDYEGVSENYYDSRNESGNASILAEYNELKKIAYNRSLKYPDSMPILDQDKFEDFSFSSSDAAKIKNSQALEKALNDTFKDDKITFDIDKDGYVTALDKNKEAAEFTMTVVDGNTLGIQKANAANRFSEKTTLKSLGLAADADGKYTMEINGAAISVDKDATIGSLLKAINASDAGVTAKFSTFTNGFEIFANDMGTGGDVLVKSSALTKALGLTATDNGSTDKNDMVGYVDGKNAILKIGDQTVYHNSNSYTIDGTTINFADADLTSGPVSIHIGITKDNTDIKQSIKDFVKDYNQLVDDVFEHIATAPQRDSKNNKYEPLTDSEKEGMDDKEIEKWETAAKKGVIYQDSTIAGIMSSIRTALYNAVDTDDGGKFGLFNMGITAINDYSEHGKLQIDEDKLDKAFEEHGDDIVKLFTDPDQGIMKKVSTVIDNAVRTTGTVKGTLIRLAGQEKGTTSKNNTIFKEMERVNERIKQLQDRYDTKEEYWWKIFTNLEKAMSDFNNQSSYMSSYLGGGSQQ